METFGLLISSGAENIRIYNKDAPIIRTIFRPKPLSNIKGKNIFLAMTADPSIEKNIKKYLESKYGCKIVQASFNLSKRDMLRDELKKSPEFDTILTELKAAAVDVLTEYAVKNKKEVSYIDNIPVATGKDSELKKELLEFGVHAKTV